MIPRSSVTEIANGRGRGWTASHWTEGEGVEGDGDPLLAHIVDGVFGLQTRRWLYCLSN